MPSSDQTEFTTSSRATTRTRESAQITPKSATRQNRIRTDFPGQHADETKCTTHFRACHDLTKQSSHRTHMSKTDQTKCTTHFPVHHEPAPCRVLTELPSQVRPDRIHKELLGHHTNQAECPRHSQVCHEPEPSGIPKELPGHGQTRQNSQRFHRPTRRPDRLHKEPPGCHELDHADFTQNPRSTHRPD